MKKLTKLQQTRIQQLIEDNFKSITELTKNGSLTEELLNVGLDLQAKQIDEIVNETEEMEKFIFNVEVHHGTGMRVERTDEQRIDIYAYEKEEAVNKMWNYMEQKYPKAISFYCAEASL